MNSSLYRAVVMHNRSEPKKHRFHYNVFMFWLDLDELPVINKKIKLFGLNRFNIFSWRSSDHVQLPADNPDTSKPTRWHLEQFLISRGFAESPARIMLLTNLRTWGYQFNPVSFYFCYGKSGEALCAVAEVGNTFGEKKLYFLGAEQLEGETFHLRIIKYFYVSPFTDHDAEFDFRLQVPGEKLNIRIDDYKGDKRFFISTLTGKKKTLNNRNVLFYALRFPFITLQIIFLIHSNALVLWLKKITYHKKSDHPELQRDVLKTTRSKN